VHEFFNFNRNHQKNVDEKKLENDLKMKTLVEMKAKEDEI
jgi:hypothetical protein